jgi:AcrR family transcriptional regulator
VGSGVIFDPMSSTEPSIQERILTAARGLFLTKGYNGSNLRDIASEAQVSMGGIYHHFDSKEDIYNALIHSQEAPKALATISELFEDPLFPENLGDIGSTIFQSVREHRDFFKLVYLDVLEFQAKNVRHIIQAFRKIISSRSADLLSHRTAKNQVADVHPAIMVRCMFDLFLYFGLEEVMLEQSLGDELQMSSEDVADQMAKIMLYGVMRRDS